MSYYIDPNGSVHCGPAPDGCTACEEGDANYLAALAALQTGATTAQQQAAATAKLAKADISALRALKAGIVIPATWLAFEASLRTVAADGGALPANPATFPDGSAMSAGW